MPAEAVKVVVRARPLNSKEKKLKCERIVAVHKDTLQIELSQPATDQYDATAPPKAFTFDAVYDWTSTQREVYDETAFPLLESVIAGYNGTIFAYGQTGCGKTFTMEGAPNPQELQGIIPRAFQQIFDTIAMNNDANTQFLVRASYMEIYNENVRDLVGNDPKVALALKEDKDKGVRVAGITECVVKDIGQIEDLMQRGNKNRSVAFTEMNADSSRSHSIFVVNIETSVPDPLKPGESKIKAGKLNLVDLAGSERQSKTAATGARLKEAAKINLSLSALGNVISALVAGKNGHVPYRDSKLTRLLQDSLGGNTKTIMIAAISPADYNYEETLSTLRYANRAKNIKNKPIVNEDPKDALLKEYQEEIKRLKAIVEAQGVNPSLAAQSNATAVSPSRRKMSIVNTAQGAMTVLTQQEDTPSAAGAARELAASEEQSQAFQAAKAEAEQRARYLEENIERERQERERLASRLEEHSHEAQKLREERERVEREMHAQLEQERARAEQIAEQMRAEAERQQELAQKLAQEAQQKATLEDQLKALQSQMLTGSEELKDQKARMEDQLRRTALKLKQEKQRQLKMKKKEAVAEEARLLLEEKYSSVEDEVKDKTQKLQMLADKYKAAQAEIKDLSDEFEDQRQGYLDDIREANREVSLYKRILRSFMSMNNVEKAVALSQYNEDREDWELPEITWQNGPFPKVLNIRRRAESSRTSSRRGRRTTDSGSQPSTPAAPRDEDDGTSWAFRNMARAANAQLSEEEEQRRLRMLTGRGLRIDTTGPTGGRVNPSPGRLDPMMNLPLSARDSGGADRSYQRAVTDMDRGVGGSAGGIRSRSSVRGSPDLPLGAPIPAGAEDIFRVMQERAAAAKQQQAMEARSRAGNRMSLTPRWEAAPLGHENSTAPPFTEQMRHIANDIADFTPSPVPSGTQKTDLSAPGMGLARPSTPLSPLDSPRVPSPSPPNGTRPQRHRGGLSVGAGPQMRNAPSPLSPAVSPRGRSPAPHDTQHEMEDYLSKVPARPEFAVGAHRPSNGHQEEPQYDKAGSRSVQDEWLNTDIPARPEFRPAMQTRMAAPSGMSNAYGHDRPSAADIALAAPEITRPAFQPGGFRSSNGFQQQQQQHDELLNNLPRPDRPQFQPHMHGSSNASEDTLGLLAAVEAARGQKPSFHAHARR